MAMSTQLIFDLSLWGASIAASLFIAYIKKDNIKYQLIALDLDGTTLTSDGYFSERTKTILERLSSNGATISICTGRSVSSLLPLLNGINLGNCTIPAVCYNGSGVFLISNGYSSVKKIFSTPFDDESAEIVLQFARDRGLCAQYYNEDNGEVFAVAKTEIHRTLLSKYAKLTGRNQILISSYESVIQAAKAAKILLLTNEPDEILAQARQYLHEDRFTLIRGSPHPFFIEVLPANISKGTGLVAMCRMLSIPLSGVVAFGDGENDVEFLQNAGLGVAVKNAKDVAKLSAKLVLEVLLALFILIIIDIIGAIDGRDHSVFLFIN